MFLNAANKRSGSFSLSGSQRARWARHDPLSIWLPAAVSGSSINTQECSFLFRLRHLMMSESGCDEVWVEANVTASEHAISPVRCVCVCVSTVSALPEEGRQQASDHAAATEAVQEPDHPGLQDVGPGPHQHGRGSSTLHRNLSSSEPRIPPALHFLFWQQPSAKVSLYQKAIFCIESLLCYY